MRISVIGCGYLGAVHAACMTVLGHEVVGIDVGDDPDLGGVDEERPVGLVGLDDREVVRSEPRVRAAQDARVHRLSRRAFRRSAVLGCACRVTKHRCADAASAHARYLPLSSSWIVSSAVTFCFTPA